MSSDMAHSSEEQFNSENAATTATNVEDEAYQPSYSLDATPTTPVEQPTYAEAFPALPEKEAGDTPMVRQGAWNKQPAIRSTNLTQIFHVPLEERRYKQINQHFGDSGEQSKICASIMASTGVSIEMSLAKDQSLTVVITGKGPDVMKARRMVLAQLQTQANVQIPIPREHHRFILGKSGKKLQELELTTATKITIPRAEEKSDMIKIVGTKEGIDKASHEIQIISEEQAKLDFQRLPIPKIYHPFICGPNNMITQKLIEETGAKINVPPPSVYKDEVVVSGEKEGVHKAVATIMAIYEEKKRKCQTVSVEVRKSQHKYVIGSKGANLHEILAETGVSVEIPPLDSQSGTITLRGEQDKLGPALTKVYSKANSVVITEVAAPAWLHRFIIGRKGATIQSITQDLPKTHIEFTADQDRIIVEGPPEEVDQAVKALQDITRDLQNRMDFAELQVDQKYHRHIIGKNGTNVTRIKNETGCAIRIPSDTEASNVIRIEGEPTGVAKAKQELMEMVNKMENERSRDILIEQRFHKTLIGARGEQIRGIREKFNQVQITFPDAGKKSAIVTLRGPKTDVDKCYKYLQQLHSELVLNNYQAEVHIFKKFHKNIIGKGGANIRKIRDETDTRIDLPSEDSESDVITITGKKASVEAAKTKIEAIQKELANIKEATIDIPHRFHNSIIGAKGRLIRSIMEECGGVIIRFPPEGTNSDKVVIRGPIDDVENATKQLQELTIERKESGFTVELKAKPEYHKFLIGRGGANIRKVRDSTGARVIFPSADDQDQELITIIGKKESTEKARVELEMLIKDLENIVTSEINVDPKFHRHFVARRGEVLRQIAEDYGGVTVSFPRSGVKSDKVVLKGAKDCVEGAKARIFEIVADLEAQVTMECVITQKFHRNVMGAKGSKVQDITKEFDVGIKFPDRPLANGDAASGEGGVAAEANQNQEEAVVNGDAASDASGEEKPKKCDIIIITGKKENCEAAKEALLALVPITEEEYVPFNFHRFIIGQKGRDVRKMMEEYGVNISVPPADEKSDVVRISGAPANVGRARAALAAKVAQLEEEREDRVLRSFQLQVEVNPQYHPKIIGRKGAVITKIRQDHVVQIQFPERGDENQGVITITGYESNCNAAKEDILKIVQDLEDMITESVSIDHRVHSRLIGARGRAIRKVMDDYKVDIKFPRQDAEDLNIVMVTGPEECVLDCKDHLLNLEEEYLQDVADIEYMQQYTKPARDEEHSNGPGGMAKGFVVRDAPWDKGAPDTSSDTAFPALGAPAAGSARQLPVWGPRR